MRNWTESEIIYTLLHQTPLTKAVILPLRIWESLGYCCLHQWICLCYCVYSVNLNQPVQTPKSHKLSISGCGDESTDPLTFKSVPCWKELYKVWSIFKAYQYVRCGRWELPKHWKRLSRFQTGLRESEVNNKWLLVLSFRQTNIIRCGPGAVYNRTRQLRKREVL